MKPVYRCRVCSAYTEEPVHCGRPAEPLMTGEQRLRLSKLMTTLLRHLPHEAGLRLDPQGWVGIDELVRGIRERWRNRHLYQWVTRDHVIAVALLDPKGRFQLDLARGRIRAAYGHTVRVELGYRPLSMDELPDKLYHGTVAENLASILSEGLKPMRRLMVHMTTDYSSAVETGRRHGPNVVVLVIDPRCLAKHGIPVYRASDTIYLAPSVPPNCITGKIARNPQSARKTYLHA
ncbi:RNA 2'-phosphotransferase [Hyperthermus butylicus]|uniref:Probable RNA 2'-phosphotransferase n=1 Tax=Hyperthermus butylicus (strain DSM 5456 / JCM 9403 / PLM1-5) TaxID=415426 RepID=KPTA_HYPBU|nr:RNA 2'-phosphotransferase [Hyperthermus butylicus]A2BMI7.1 RecName: Full=Probable RNA 2'-phosphotransferase [Hyperthermus butylicus DSM 5456]ABM81198.1 RNA:NAD 2'-phosphotransferase [Hyperthermus butylicus DSM 5456]